jgi:flagellar basal-body rod protein FlgC
MSLLRTLDIASTGMAAQRTRMNVAAMNIANQNTTRTEEGGPYKRRDVVLQSTQVDTPKFADALAHAMPGTPDDDQAWGVAAEEIVVSNDEPVLVYDPGHPDADETGHVAMPNVSGIKEMVNMMGAARAYEAGTTVMKTVSDMAEQALRIGR